MLLRLLLLQRLAGTKIKGEVNTQNDTTQPKTKTRRREKRAGADKKSKNRAVDGEEKEKRKHTK